MTDVTIHGVRTFHVWFVLFMVRLPSISPTKISREEICQPHHIATRAYLIELLTRAARSIESPTHHPYQRCFGLFFVLFL
jgi:hypothetical protein